MFNFNPIKFYSTQDIQTPPENVFITPTKTQRSITVHLSLGIHMDV